MGGGIVLIYIENLSIKLKLMILWNLVNLGPRFESIIPRWQKCLAHNVA
jgi:hypothetical protein